MYVIDTAYIKSWIKTAYKFISTCTMHATCMIITIILIDTITSFIGEKVPILVYKQSSIRSGICLSVFHKVL